MSRPPSEDELAVLLDNPAYRRWKVAEYEHWALYLNSDDQMLLGRSYAWLNRHHIDSMSFAELTHDELHELIYVVFSEYEQAVRKCWPGVTAVNFEWLGNETRHHRGHGHAHFIPRYAGNVAFAGKTFFDPNQYKRRTYERRELPEEPLEHIRFALKSAIGR